MKKVLIIILFAYFTSSQSANCQNSFKNPSGYIELLEFRGDGMFLKLTLEGMTASKKREGRQTIASKVLSLHKKMSGGSSDLKVNCIASRIYYHMKAFYSSLNKLSKDWFKKRANPINATYVELIWDGCVLPLDIIPD